MCEVMLSHSPEAGRDYVIIVQCMYTYMMLQTAQWSNDTKGQMTQVKCFTCYC